MYEDDETITFEDIETMQQMAKRLGGCGSGVIAKKVQKACNEFWNSNGALDSQNVAVALLWLAVSLVGKSAALGALQRAANLAEIVV